MTRRSWALLAIGAVAALALRVLLIACFQPPATPHYSDQWAYHSTAVSLTQNTDAWLQRGSEFGYRAPLFFAFLAFIYELTGTSAYAVGQVANATIGLLNALLCFEAARRLWTIRAAWVAFGIRAFAPNFIIGDTFIMSDPLFTAIQTLLVLLLCSPPAARPAIRSTVLGVLAGLAALARESGLAYVPIVAIIAGARARPDARLRTLALVLSGSLVVCLPWMIRNAIVWGAPLPLSHTMGVNLHVGNRPDSRAGYGELHDRPPAGIGFGSPAASSWYAKKAIDYISSNPLRFAQSGILKVSNLAGPTFNRDEMRNVYSMRPNVLNGLALLSGLSSAVILCAGLMMLVVSTDRVFRLVAGLICAYYLAVAFVFFGAPRLREPVDVLLILALAGGIHGLLAGTAEHRGEHLRRSRVRLRMAVTFGVLCALWMIHLSQRTFG